MLAGRNVGLFVGVLTMGGKRLRRNEKEGKRKVRGKMGEKAGEREREREGKCGDRILILIMVKTKCATVLLRFVCRIVANNMVILIIQFVS